MPALGSESEFEATTLARLQLLGWQHVPGADLDRDLRDVVLIDVLRANLAKRYPKLPPSALDLAVQRIAHLDGVDTLRRNRHFHVDRLAAGFDLPVDRPDGSRQHAHIWPVDFDNVAANTFQAVNQLTVQHDLNARRPDIVLYVNGLPLVVIELKKPGDEEATAEGARKQIAAYGKLVPQLFAFNVVCVASDDTKTWMGPWCAGGDHWAPWRSTDGESEETGPFEFMATLVKGLLTKDRLLAYARDFVLYEQGSEQGAEIVKKGAKYHQFFAVQKAVERLRTAAGDRKLGVIWHTTGSGKSLTMAFLVGVLRRMPELDNPLFVVQVDRRDLDDQLFEQFAVARHLVGIVDQADSISDLRRLLQTDGGGVVFTTMQKFARRSDDAGVLLEERHPVLTERRNVIVIADEAHRSQYGLADGYARWMRQALPNAMLLGFTGTPVTLHDADTCAVFGDYIDIYHMAQSTRDGATVPIWYTIRQSRLIADHVAAREAIGRWLAEAGDGAAPPGRWKQLEAFVRNPPRVAEVAIDLLGHFRERRRVLEEQGRLPGKAMVVCISRHHAVEMAESLRAQPNCPELAVVISGNLAEDPADWADKGYQTTSDGKKAIKARLRKADDPLQIVVVCDMWLTGTDIPCLDTLYLDKPMQGHTIIQAVSRVNRVFAGKSHGLIVDYIGVGDALRDATNRYTNGGGQGTVAAEIATKAWPLFLAAIDEVRVLVAPQADLPAMVALPLLARADATADLLQWLVAATDRRDGFLACAAKVARVWPLVCTLAGAEAYADEVALLAALTGQVRKTMPGLGATRDTEAFMHSVVAQTVDAARVQDLLKAAGLPAPDVSILDDAFLQTFKDQPREDLRLRVLNRLLEDHVRNATAKAPHQQRDLLAELEEAMARYHQRALSAAEVMAEFVRIKKRMDQRNQRAAGMPDDEYAFYEAVEAFGAQTFDEPHLRALVHDVVGALKRNLRVDWTAEHRGQVQAAVRAAVQRALRRHGVAAGDLQAWTDAFYDQARREFASWPLAA